MLEYTPIDEIPTIVDKLRKTYKSHVTKSLEWRLHQLNQLKQMFEKHVHELEQALDKDLQSTLLLKASEIQSVIFDCEVAIQKLPTWIASEDQPNSFLMTTPGTARVVKEPYGVVCIIAPWNYPISLTMRPAIGAIAAGNCVLLKPSEVSSNCSHVLSQLIPQYLDTNAIALVNGAIDETAKVLDQKFDYIFYTGNSTVGRIIMQKASVHLTPVTLELGGKSPLYVDNSFDWDVGISRIVWGKLLNNGQTCVAPDYILLDKSVDKDKFIEKLKSKIEQFYGVGSDTIKNNKDYSRIINQHHTKRLASLLEGQNIVFGGTVDVEDCFVEPTIIYNPELDSKVMTDEIFGPILPIVPIENYKQAIEFINERAHPLALYIFSNDERVQNNIIRYTASGGVTVNDCVLHIVTPFLKFGGVGESGMGGYNGKFTFDTFTHEKSVLLKPNTLDLDIRYPPYTEGKVELFKQTFSFFNSIRGAIGAASTLGSYFWGSGSK
jgi:aldehyde dehydrogenase (NAD+)